jgi:hypothetical protein
MTASAAAIAAMEEDTIEVVNDFGSPIAMAVRLTDRQEDDDAFYYDTDWLEWLHSRGLMVVGSMVPVNQDTDGKFLWFVAVR